MEWLLWALIALCIAVVISAVALEMWGRRPIKRRTTYYLERESDT